MTTNNEPEPVTPLTAMDDWEFTPTCECGHPGGLPGVLPCQRPAAAMITYHTCETTLQVAPDADGTGLWCDKHINLYHVAAMTQLANANALGLITVCRCGHRWEKPSDFYKVQAKLAQVGTP